MNNSRADSCQPKWMDMVVISLNDEYGPDLPIRTWVIEAFYG